MSRIPLIAACFLLALLKPLSAYYLTIDAHAEECFFDRVTTGTKMGLTFEVIDGGFYDIDVKITGQCQILAALQTTEPDVLPCACFFRT